MRILRKSVGSQRIFVPGVRAVVVNQGGEILLQRRTDFDLWGLPGGAVEIGETAVQALKREVKEETGIDVVQAKPMGLYTGMRQQFAYPNGDQVQCFAVAFVVDRWTGTPVADGQEGAEVCFFSLMEIPENVVPIHRQTIKDFESFDGTFVLSE